MVLLFIFPNENIYCDPSLEPSHRDSSNEGSQHVFIEKSRKNFFEFSSIPPLICLWEAIVFCLFSTERATALGQDLQTIPFKDKSWLGYKTRSSKY